MLMNDEFELLWSTWIDEEICSNIYNDNCNNNCGYDGGCAYRNDDEYDYDFMNMVISEDLEERFGENGFEYFVVGTSCFWYGGYEGNKPNMETRVSPLYDSIQDILYMLDYCEDFRIYKGKYNSLWLEGSHHDGSELYQICRLNKQGQKYYDLDYNFDYKKYATKKVLKDFDFFK